MAALTVASLAIATLAAPSTVAQSDPDLRLPFVGAAVWSSTPATHTGASSQAVDFAPADGPDAWDGSVMAAQNGQVIYAGFQENDPVEPCPVDPDEDFGYGNLVILADEASGLQTYYAHLASIADDVVIGSDIAQGTDIGLIGDTGCVDGIELHFEAREGGASTPFGGTSINVLGLSGMSPVGTAVGPAFDDGTTPPETTGLEPVLSGQWISPADGSTVDTRTELVAWPSSRLADVDVSQVVFQARWADGAAELCSATSGDADGLWRCTPVLSAGVPLGPVELSFDIFDDAGDLTTAADTLSVIVTPASPPKVGWAKGTSKSAAHVRFSDSVDLVAKVSSDAGLQEVRFIAYYPGWAKPNDASKVAGFDPKEDWRVVAICRPSGVSLQPARTKGCRWQGDERSATVTYRWDPTVGEPTRSVPDLPKARAAVTEASKSCVPVTLGIEATDVQGEQASAPGGRIAPRCDAAAKNLGRRVYLDPLTPPAAPAGVRLDCKDAEPSYRDADYACYNFVPSERPTLRWQDRSGNEDGFNVYVRRRGGYVQGSACGPGGKFTPAASAWVKVATLPAGTTSWRPRWDNVLQQVKIDFRSIETDMRVAAYNAAGESSRLGSVTLLSGQDYC